MIIKVRPYLQLFWWYSSFLFSLPEQLSLSKNSAKSELCINTLNNAVSVLILLHALLIGIICSHKRMLSLLLIFISFYGFQGLIKKFKQKDSCYTVTTTFNYDDIMSMVIPFLVSYDWLWNFSWNDLCFCGSCYGATIVYIQMERTREINHR